MTGDTTISDLWSELVTTWRWDSPISVFFAIVLGSFAAGLVVKLILPLRVRSWLFSLGYKTLPGFAATLAFLFLACLLVLNALPALLPSDWVPPLTDGGDGVSLLLLWGLAMSVAGFIASFIFGSVVALNHYDLKRLDERRPKR